MIPSRENLLATARTTGFDSAMLEKVLRLLDLLDGLHSHPYLKGRWVLKGGTALNLFLLNVPRLSVDIDLNYVGSPVREVMIGERPKVAQALEAVFARHGLAVRRAPAADEHAGGKWSLRYDSVLGHGGNLAVDLNYLLRVPLWPPEAMDSQDLGGSRATGIPILDIHELAAGKLAALLSRHAARDLFDAHHLLTEAQLDPTKLRIAFVVYGAMNRKDWRTVKPNDADFDVQELREELIPLLRARTIQGIKSTKAWATAVKKECRIGLKSVLPFNAPEKNFLDGILDRGDIDPSLLTDAKDLADRIANHPGLQWKALNVRQFKKNS